MKILLLYASSSRSNSIVSSTIHKFEHNPVEGIDVERFNIIKRSIKKYLKNKKETNELPDVIYLFKDDDYVKLEEYPEIRVVKYNRNIIYKPARVPGNKLKTIVYKLYDKIISDIKSNYSDKITYKVNTKTLEINEVVTDEFSYEFPQYNNHLIGFETRVEAENAIRRYLLGKKSSYENLLAQKEKEILEIKENIKIIESKL